jgi:hypothetical protein
VPIADIRQATLIGRIERGFDFLGYHFSPAGLAVAKQTVANFIEKASQLYEQERRAASAASPLGMYIKRWLRWAKGGVWVDSRGPAIMGAYILFKFDSPAECAMFALDPMTEVISHTYICIDGGDCGTLERFKDRGIV